MGCVLIENMLITFSVYVAPFVVGKRTHTHRRQSLSRNKMPRSNIQYPGTLQLSCVVISSCLLFVQSFIWFVCVKMKLLKQSIPNVCVCVLTAMPVYHSGSIKALPFFARTHVDVSPMYHRHDVMQAPLSLHQRSLFVTPDSDTAAAAAAAALGADENTRKTTQARQYNNNQTGHEGDAGSHGHGARKSTDFGGTTHNPDAVMRSVIRLFRLNVMLPGACERSFDGDLCAAPMVVAGV